MMDEKEIADQMKMIVEGKKSKYKKQVVHLCSIIYNMGKGIHSI